MSYHRLSQAEIDMLLGGPSSDEDETGFSQAEMDTIGEIGSIAMGAAATSLGQLLSRNVSISNPRVSLVTLEQYCQESPTACFMSTLELQEGLDGRILLVMQELEASLIVDLLFGNDGSNPQEQMGEMELSALTEAVNQIAGNMMTSLSALYKKRIVVGSAELHKSDLSLLELPAGYTLDDRMAKTVFRFELGELSDSVLTMMIPLTAAKNMVKAFEEATMPMPTTPPPTTRPAVASTPSRDTAAEAARPLPGDMAMPSMQYSGAHSESVNAQPVQFQPFSQEAYVGQQGNLNLILDVPLQITVELGRTRRQVKEVLDLGTGSIIALDKLTGDPVDILVNGKPIAEGEVVIIDENFAVRITKIKNVSERLGTLQ